MYVKRIKRKCGVRGCKNTDSYAISKSREAGNSIIACKECLLEALAVIEEANKPLTPVEAHTEPTDAIPDEGKVVNTPLEEETPVEAPVEAPKRKRQRAQ